MVELAKIFLEFIIAFLITYFGTFLFFRKKMDKFDKKKMPVNISYLINKYKIDIVRIGYKKVFKTLLLCDAFIVACVFTITRFIDNIYIRMITSFFLVFPLFAGVYHLLAMYYKKECAK